MKKLVLILLLAGCTNQEKYVVQGTPGEPGDDCTVESMVGGAIIHCGETSAVILNGIDGAQGPQGAPGVTSPYNIVGVIDPCGDGPGFDEILLQMQNGQLVAYFETGGNRFLSLLSNGNYRTTDQQSCNFSVLNGAVL